MPQIVMIEVTFSIIMIKNLWDNFFTQINIIYDQVYLYRGSAMYYVRNIFPKTNISYPVCVSVGKCEICSEFTKKGHQNV